MNNVNATIVDATIQVEPIYLAQTNAFGLLDYPFLIDIIGKSHANRILDIGTGEGTFLLGLAQRAHGTTFDAIDLNEHLIETVCVTRRSLDLWQESENAVKAVFGQYSMDGVNEQVGA